MSHLHTFDEWKSMGKSVIKGQKSVGRNSDGICVFSEKQVQDSRGSTYYADSYAADGTFYDMVPDLYNMKYIE